MKKFKHCFQNKVNWIAVFVFILGNLIIFWNFSWISFFVALTVFLFFCFQKVDFKTKKIAIFLMLSSVIISFFNLSMKINLVNWFENLVNFSLSEKIIDFIKNNHESLASDFILLIVFNIKQNEGWNFYNQLNLLSIGHLAVVSGFHFNVLYGLIKKLLIKWKLLKNVIFTFITLMLLYFQQFNYSILLSVLMQIFYFKKIRIRDYKQRLCLAGVLIILFFPHAIKSYGFQLSILARTAIAIVLAMKIKNNFFSSLLITFFVNILIFPIIGNFNTQFSLWAFLLSILYSWLFIFNFITCFFFFPFYWLSPLFSSFFWIQIHIFNFFVSINVSIRIIDFNFLGTYFYNFILISLLFFLVYKKQQNQEVVYQKFNNFILFDVV